MFEHEAWADRALPAALERHGVSSEERGLAQRLAFGAVQRRGTSDALVAEVAGRPVDDIDAPLLAALRLGIYELLFADATPDYAAVHQAVELAKESARSRRAAGLVNAVLRRASTAGPDFLARLQDDDPAQAAVKHSHPLWLVEKWVHELGRDRAASLMAADNEPMPSSLRANTHRIDAATLAERLSADGVIARHAIGPPPLDVPELIAIDGALGSAAELIESGDVVPQSRGSAAAVALLDPRPRERVLDLCAGPGIKSTQIAARMQNDGEVVSVEVDPARASRLRELASRLGATNIEVVEADAAVDDFGAGYDRVLVDPPCSDLGTLASRPDARWRKSPELIARLAELQGRILRRAAAALRPGGTLVYSTCTISVEENESRIATLAGAERDELAVDSLGVGYPDLASPHDDRFLQTFPDRDRCDGFFLARLRSAS